MLDKPIETVTADDIRSLIGNRATEGRSLDYKEQLPSGNDDGRRDFLGDVCSFANTADGHIVFGVSEERDASGRPTGIPAEGIGLVGNLDAEVLKLESAVRDGIEPRIPGIRWHPVAGFPAGPVLVCRIPKSWQAPHMVTFKNLSRFYARGASGKFQLDVQQIRGAFIASDTLREGIRRFRQERLARIVGDDTPLSLQSRARVILHLVPLSGLDAVGANEVIDLSKAHPRLLYGGADGYRYNFDGVLGYSMIRDGGGLGYVQVFRNGAIEAVDAALLEDGLRRIPSIAFERQAIQSLMGYLRDLVEWNLSGPIFIMLSMVGVKGYRMAVSERFLVYQETPIERDSLVVPEVWLEELPPLDALERAAVGLLRRPLDVIWQAAGWPGSPNFNDAGEWKPR